MDWRGHVCVISRAGTGAGLGIANLIGDVNRAGGTTQTLDGCYKS